MTIRKKNLFEPSYEKWKIKTCISHHKGDTLSNRSEAGQSPHFTQKVKLGRTKINIISPSLSTLELGTHFFWNIFKPGALYQSIFRVIVTQKKSTSSNKKFLPMVSSYCTESWIKAHPLNHKCWWASTYITLSQIHPSLSVTVWKYCQHHQQNHLSFFSSSVFHNKFPWQFKWQFFNKFLI